MPDNSDAASDAPDALEIQVAAHMARQHGADNQQFLRDLAALLESALSGEAIIERAGLWGGDKRPVRRIEATFAEDGGRVTTRYTLEDTGRGQITSTRAQIVGGIALKNEPISPTVWIEAVSRAMVRRAEQNKATRDALQGLLP